MNIPTHYVKNPDGSFSHPSRVARLPPAKPEQDKVPALDSGTKARRRSKNGLVLIVTLVRCSQRLLDDDNLTSSFKATRDAIAASLGVADNDKRVRWEYGQVVSASKPGTMLKFTLI